MRKTPLHPNEIHHIYNRGVNYGDIFFTRANRDFFLRRLRYYCPPQTAEIIAYCLMPNHFHLLLRVLGADFGRTVMQPFSVSYTKAINKQEGRAGPLFQGPYPNRIVKTESDLLHLSRYIHLNPVAAGFVVRPEDWEYSSYLEYIGLRKGTLPKKEIVLGHFPSPESYAAFINEPQRAEHGIMEGMLFD